MTSTASKEVTVEDLPYFDRHVRDTTVGADVARLLEQDHGLPGIIVMGEKGFRGLVSRNQFFQRLGRLFGIEVYSTRPITAFLDSLPTPPLVLPGHTTIQSAAIVCLARPAENVYDPFVVTMPNGPPRLVDFLALILKQTELVSEAQTEAQTQKAEAIAANNAKSEFLAKMSHELRTPLTAIIGYGEILLEDSEASGQEATISRLRNIISAGLHLLEMINGILDLAKIESGKMEIFLESFSPSALVEEIAGTVGPLMQKNNNTFSLSCAQDLGVMKSDELKLKQCLLNLLGNASKFTQNGRVDLRVTRESDREGAWAVFQVTDTGIGMNESQVNNLFEPFYQADSSISRRYGGTGLGLSLTKQFCDMLGGNLSVKSEMDRGTCFTMRLPFGTKDPGDRPVPISKNQD